MEHQQALGHGVPSGSHARNGRFAYLGYYFSMEKMYFVSDRRLAETVREITHDAPMLFETNGSLARLGGKPPFPASASVRCYPKGMIVTPKFMPTFGLLTTDIVWLDDVGVKDNDHENYLISHRSKEVASPIALYVGEEFDDADPLQDWYEQAVTR